MKNIPRQTIVAFTSFIVFLMQTFFLTPYSLAADLHTLDFDTPALSSPNLKSSNLLNPDPSELSEPSSPEIIIKAINPGYTLDKVANAGEFIELINLSGHPISLTDFSLQYTNGSGNTSLLYSFPDGSEFIGERILLRLASSPEASQADARYSKSLAMSAGPLDLIKAGTIIDSVCWTGKNGCYPAFKSGTFTSLVRDLTSKDFTIKADYIPDFDHENPGLKTTENLSPEENNSPHCAGLQFSELLSYYENNLTEQFIELYNSTEETITLDGCSIKYKNKIFPLSGEVPAANFLVRRTTDIKLTKNPSTSNNLIISDADDSIVDQLTYYHGQKRGTSYAQFGYDHNGAEQWRTTYQPTPGSNNVYQEFRTCPSGKVINPETGNCIKAASIASALKDCPAGKYRNPATGRCKSFKKSSITTCRAGYERNPATNRCRKIRENNGAAYSLTPSIFSEKSTFVALLAVMILIALGAIYMIFQFRHELKQKLRKIFSKLLPS